VKPKFKYVYRGSDRKISQSDRDKIEKMGYIPYSWDDVDIFLKDERIIAIGMLKGIKRYLYKKEFRKEQNDKKCDRMKEFGKQLKTIKDNILHKLSKDKLSRKKVIATGLWILLMSSIRVGNSKYLKENGTYGLTTLQKKHVKLSGSNAVLDFVGKKSVQNYVKIHIPNKKLLDLFHYLHKHADPFFLSYEGSRICSQEINDYIKDYYGDKFTAKDFRTWGANVIFLNRLAEIETKDLKEMKPRDVNKFIKGIVDETAEKLNNTPTVLKSNYLCHHILDRLKEDPHALIKRVKAARDIDKLLIELL
jgi:DNA topoisomerase-1